MKSIKSGLFIAALMLLSVMSSYAQSADQLQLVSQEKITPVQAGTMQLVNGSLTISLSEATLKQLSAKDATYYISLSPIGDCGQLKVKEKTANQFTIQELSPTGSNDTFDYVVMVKKTVYTGVKRPVVNK